MNLLENDYNLQKWMVIAKHQVKEVICKSGEKVHGTVQLVQNPN